MATTSHIDYRKIDYDQLIDKPIVRTSAEIDTINVAGVYDKGDGKRIIVSVDGNNVTQVIEEKNGYQERTSTDGGTTWGNRDVVVFSDSNDKWDKVIISQNEPVNPVETTAWLNITDDSFNIYDGSAWHTIAGGGTTEVPYIPTFSGVMNGTTTNFTNSNIEAGDGIILVGTTSGHPAGLWEYNVSVGGFTINSTESENHVAFKYLIVKSHGIAVIEQADEIEYDNTESGLTSDNVQDAIDELANKNPQVETMPTADSTNEGKIVQYVGETTASFTQGYFYKCVESSTPGTYEWTRIDVQPGTVINELNDIGDVSITTPANGEVLKYDSTNDVWYNAPDAGGDDIIYVTQAEYDLLTPAEKADANKHYAIYENATGSGIQAGDVEYDNTTSGLSADNVQEAIDEVNTKAEMGSQIAVLPSPSSTVAGKIYQYIGATTVDYINGYFYKCVAGQTAGTYEWQNIDVQIAKTTLVDLEDTNITNPQDGDVIKYDATTQKYVNAPDEGGLAYTPTSPYKPKYHRVGTQAQYDALSQYYTEQENDTMYFTI